MITGATSSSDVPAFMRRLLAAADVSLTATGAKLADNMVRTLGRDHGGIRSRPGQQPNSQTGLLSRSIGYTKASGLSCIVGSGVKYAKYLEFGANIRAKKKALLIPLSRLAQKCYMDSNGDGRGAISAYEAKVGPKNVVRISRPGHWLIGHKVGGKKARIEFDFMLTARAIIKPRPFLRPAVAKAKADGSLQRVFSGEMQKEMAKK